MTVGPKSGLAIVVCFEGCDNSGGHGWRFVRAEKGRGCCYRWRIIMMEAEEHVKVEDPKSGIHNARTTF